MGHPRRNRLKGAGDSVQKKKKPPATFLGEHVQKNADRERRGVMCVSIDFGYEKTEETKNHVLTPLRWLNSGQQKAGMLKKQTS